MESSNEKMYYIQSMKHTGYVGNAVLWWGKDHKGYTTDLTQAGKYTEEEKNSIIFGNEVDVAYPCEFIDNHEFGKKLIFDGQYLKDGQSKSTIENE